MTHHIPFSTIQVSEDRQRKDFDPDALTDLANSIAQHGLLHPIVVRGPISAPTLVAGERRLRALEQLWMLGTPIRHNSTDYAPDTVPCVHLGELSPIDAEEAELDENLKRRDLTWQEQANALSRLHKLREAQAAELGQRHTISDTMEEVSGIRSAPGVSLANYGEVRQAILLSDHLSNPEVSKAKSVKDAIKILQKAESTAKNKELAERVGRTFNSSAHSLLHTDCLEWLRVCPANSFDVVLTDPPYGMGADNFGDAGGKLTGTDHQYDDSLESWNRLTNQLCPLLYRVTKPLAHAYVFCDIDNFHALKRKMEAAGWYVFRTPLIAYKPNSGRVPLPEHGPRRQWESILYAFKGKKPVTGIYSDVIPCNLEENLGHGANKPVELYSNLLRRSVRPGDCVLDCFAGTGTIFPAAHELKVRATGIEIDASYYGIAVQRLNALDEEPALL